MIRCPSCHHEEMVGALFCSQCGAGLNYQEVSPPHTGEYASKAIPGGRPPRGTPASLPEQPASDAPTMPAAERGPADQPAPAAQRYPEPVPPAMQELRYTSGTLGAAVSIKIVDSGHILPLEGGSEFTIGRISGNQPILPDIDLTPYQAYEGGVSRLHATIKLGSNQVTITDLGSANGTQVNGVKVTAHQPVQLSDGDRISLGKFKIQIILRK